MAVRDTARLVASDARDRRRYSVKHTWCYTQRAGHPARAAVELVEADQYLVEIVFTVARYPGDDIARRSFEPAGQRLAHAPIGGPIDHDNGCSDACVRNRARNGECLVGAAVVDD